MAIKKACIVGNSSIKNTGKECDSVMGAPAMLIAIDPKVTFTEADLEDPYAWLNNLIHLKKAYPLFGQKAPVRSVANASESDVVVTLDDGSKVFVRYGMFTRTLQTTSGGLCYAASLQSFLNSGLSIIEIDKSGQMLVRLNEDDTMSGIITSVMFSPTPVLGDMKDVYKNQFQYTIDPVEYVNNGSIMNGAQPLLSMMGLIDVKLKSVPGVPSTATTLKFFVKTECGELNLIDVFGAKLPATTNFIVKNAAGTVVVTSSATIVADHVELTGTFPSGTYTVTGAAPTVWKTALMEGYDASSHNLVIVIS